MYVDANKTESVIKQKWKDGRIRSIERQKIICEWKEKTLVDRRRHLKTSLWALGRCEEPFSLCIMKNIFPKPKMTSLNV